MSVRYFEAPDAARRIAAARDFLLARPTSEPFLAIGATRAAADRLAMEALEARGPGAASLGAFRHAFGGLASALAAPKLAAAGLRPLEPAAEQAILVRLVRRFDEKGRLGALARVAESPGLPIRLAATFRELRLAGLDADRIETADPMLGALYRSFSKTLEDAGLADRARVLEAAVDAVRETPRLPVGAPTVFLDVPLGNRASRRFAEALVEAASEALLIVPEGDRWTEVAARACGATPVAAVPEPEAAAGDALEAARRHLFRTSRPDPETSRAGLSVLAAPGAFAEAVEIASALLAEARGGARFDRMAVLLPRPASQAPAFREAFDRAGIPAFFERGARRPHPAGRAFLLLLDCALEGLPSTRFAEYLSLGETPAGGDDAFAAPRRWERLIRDADVVGGLLRWKQRRGQLEERLREDGEGEAGPGSEDIRRRADEVRRLSAAVFPILRALDALPERAGFGEWTKRLAALARMTLRNPEGVLACLDEAAPGAGETTLDQMRRVLAPRLAELVYRSAESRQGRVWIGAIEAARGLSFEVVALPGLSERAFPRVVREDPLLLDRKRRDVSSDLRLRADLGEGERLRLRIAVGAASRRLLLGFPSLDPAESRPQVPSYYLAETFRAGFGRIPSLAGIRETAARASRVVRGVRAPLDSASAIDRREFDLSRVALELGRSDGAATPGSAAYLLGEPTLARALRQEYMRQGRKWQSPDGFLNPGPEARAALEAHRPANRSFSPTGLEAFAACPYQFFLKNIARLSSRRAPESVLPLDPLTRGSLLHEVFFHMGKALRKPLPRERLGDAFRRLEAIFWKVEAAYRERLAPPVRRIWKDEMDGLLGDLRGFLERHAGSGRALLANELAFGMPAGKFADPQSAPEPPVLSGGLRAHGSIDAVEELADGRIQVTDYKTGRAPAPSDADGVLFGGKTLQPMVYARAYEALTGGEVASARLYYPTIRGVYSETVVDTAAPESRETFDRFLKALDRAIGAGHFPAAPRADGFFSMCDYCDYQPVCGPRPAGHGRTKRPPEEDGQLAELGVIRSLP